MEVNFDAYFKVPHDQFSNNILTLKHDATGEIVAENINAFSIGITPDLQFVKVRITQENLSAFVSGVPEGVNPWTYEGAAAVGLGNSYIGHTWEEVQTQFPNLTTTTEKVDSEGNKYWSSELQDTTIL